MHAFETEAMQKAIEIQKGRIVAKAIVRRSNGQYEAVVVFAGSLPYDFFFTYKIRSPRSPRKAWKSTGSLIRNHAASFEERVAQYAITSTIVSVKIYHARKLKELMRKSDLDFYGLRQEPEPWQVRNTRAKMATKFRGGMPTFSGWRNR
jgi:hypothetical protein